MAQATENVDFERLFQEAEALDNEGESNASSGTTIHADNPTVMDHVVEPEQEQEAAPVVDQEALPQVDLEPEPRYTQEELDEFERQEIIAAQQEANRAARDYQARTGKPLVDPKILEARQKRREAVQDVAETTPQFLEAIQEVAEQTVAAAEERAMNRIDARAAELADEVHLQQVFTNVPGADELLSDPNQYAQLQDWVDHLPGFMSARFNEVLDGGSTDEVIGLLSDYAAFPDWQDASNRYLELEGQGGETVVTQPQAEQQQERRPRRQSRAVIPEAALAVRSGTMRTLPQGEPAGAGVTEYERAYNDPEIIKLADQA